MVSCGESVPTCATPAAGAVAAARAAGMEATSCDGKLNPQGWSECIRQGISAKVDGIIVIGQDCSSFQSALQEAKNAGIPTIGAGGNDCDISGGDKLYSATTQMLPDMTAQQWWEKMGALQAAWIIDKTDGKASVLSLKFTDAIWGGWIQDGFEAELATCDGCKVEETLELGNQDVGSGQLPQKVSTALLKTPTANAVNVPLDGWFFAGLAQAIQSSGRSNDLNVIGNFGEVGNLDFIRNSGGEHRDGRLRRRLERLGRSRHSHPGAQRRQGRARWDRPAGRRCGQQHACRGPAVRLQPGGRLRVGVPEAVERLVTSADLTDTARVSGAFALEARGVLQALRWHPGAG